jgi:hypothetical protein
MLLAPTARLPEGALWTYELLSLTASAPRRSRAAAGSTSGHATTRTSLPSIRLSCERWRRCVAASEQKAKSAILRRVRQCRVSFRDSEGIEHAVELEARTLYKAVRLAIERFRRCEHVMYDPKGLHEFVVGIAGAWHPTPADQEHVRRLAPPAGWIARGRGAQDQFERALGRRRIGRRRGAPRSVSAFAIFIIIGSR